MRNALPECRRALGWSQERLADTLGVSRQTIISIEKGRYDPSLPLAMRLARVFGRPVEELFLLDDEPEASAGPGASEADAGA
ncbi:helix-turn-helix transcriptional regulator [Leucobacter sp. M11]|uniref:helix-turn-helix transcriptional regulator n=1 Tax=Leucobacter sp. M11 TaxID=2993565 RepID=UPI002D7E7252|nr:helix-turn-helix transcriptional regulator [Leucobacter sp. M11]MEB4615821.1 helix-turn-helix transcriptional regulator [Leucobacter sp. M11]